jgi:glycine/D-amino acid oxidase-like deaminating enzyme
MPQACEASQCGTIWVAADEEEMQGAQRKMRIYADAGITCEVLDSASLRKHEPNLRAGLAGGLRVPDDLSVYPTNCTQWFLRDVEVKSGVKVRSIQEQQVGDEQGNQYLGDNIILAAGALSSELLPKLPVTPRKGHLIISERAENFCFHQLVELGYLKSAHEMGSESVAFNIQPRTTGQVLLGSSREFCGWDGSINRSIVNRMIARGMEYMPALAELPALRIWTGFRPCTQDSLPLIGGWPAIRGLYVAAGHEGLGITTSLGTAELITSAIARSKPAFDPAPYTPSRGAMATS